MTAFWAMAFALSAGAPVLALWLKRRGAARGRIALAVWLPAIVLIAICAVGLILSPP